MCLGAVLMLSRAVLLLGLPWVFEPVWSGSELAWGRLGRDCACLGPSWVNLGDFNQFWLYFNKNFGHLGCVLGLS